MTSWSHRHTIKVSQSVTRWLHDGYAKASRRRVAFWRPSASSVCQSYCHRVEKMPDGHTNQQDVHTMVSRWPHGGREGHTKSTRRCNFGKTFGNFLTCQRFCEHSRSCCRTLKTQPADTRWLRMPSRMTRCVHDHSRCCKFPSSCVHRESKSGQCDASISIDMLVKRLHVYK